MRRAMVATAVLVVAVLGSPVSSSWATRDTLGYVDGMNLYEYERSNTVNSRDPEGTRILVACDSWNAFTKWYGAFMGSALDNGKGQIFDWGFPTNAEGAYEKWEWGLGTWAPYYAPKTYSKFVELLHRGAPINYDQLSIVDVAFLLALDDDKVHVFDGTSFRDMTSADAGTAAARFDIAGGKAIDWAGRKMRNGLADLGDWAGSDEVLWATLALQQDTGPAVPEGSVPLIGAKLLSRLGLLRVGQRDAKLLTLAAEDAKLLTPITDASRLLTQGKGDPFHHIFPKAADLAAQFGRAGVQIDKFTTQILKSVHDAIHSGGPRGGAWNDAWRAFFEAHPQATAEDIYKYAGELLYRFQVPGGPVVPYPH